MLNFSFLLKEKQLYFIWVILKQKWYYMLIQIKNNNKLNLSNYLIVNKT